MPAGDNKPQNAPPTAWRDLYPDSAGGWPDLYKRLDALRARIARLRTEPKTAAAPASVPSTQSPVNQKIPK